MSYSVDANLLLYASDRTSRFHEAASSFLEGLVEDPEILCLTWPSLMAYVRIATHPRIFKTPLAPEEALRNVTTLLSLPRARAISEEDGFLDVYREVTGGFPVRGNFVPDAHVAALLRQHGVRRIYTADADFRKFDFLDVQNPLSP